ncbi:MAG: hypothetical protein JO219_01630 [Candidatus Eremiobacteraeota bacterium]|nr:hypothetical protein [Candidatus Eremiobacteraeota bacterium]MBV8366101.1 hypothetical protein [Candidatus Eremiobacteraeota bacterium]
MALEVWNTIFAGATFAVIAATAIAALIQLRHLRAGNQLNALLTFMQMWDKPDMQSHISYTHTELQPKLKDPAFLAQFREPGVSRDEHPELLVADYWEQIGAYMKYDLVDARPWLDVAAPQAIRAWNDLEPAIMSMRERFGLASFENFEYIAVRARQWIERYPNGNYPASVPRMNEMKRGT